MQVTESSVAASRALLPFELARSAVLEACSQLPREPVELAAAGGHVLAGDLVCTTGLPAFASSAVDGFAVRTDDLADATVLRLVGESRAGRPAGGELAGGTAMIISTGAEIPIGADAVIPIENAREIAGGKAVAPTGACSRGDNVRPAAQDLLPGETAMHSGVRIGAGELAVATACGASHLYCRQRPSVAIVTTGDEVVEPGAICGPGQIWNSNGPMLEMLAAGTGAVQIERNHADDNRSSLADALSGALQADVTIVCGGVSVGQHDHVKAELADFGVDEVFWRVALKPGKPIWFGVNHRAGKSNPGLVFGLPGNPLSAFVGFHCFVRPAVERLLGLPSARCRQRGVLAVDVERDPVRTRVVVSASSWPGARRLLRPHGRSGSHMVATLAGADALAYIPAGRSCVKAGETVEIEELR